MPVALTSAIDLLNQGGAVMWILIALSVLALAITFDRCWQFARAGVWRARTVHRALVEWETGRYTAARRALVSRGGRGDGPVADVLGAAIAGHLDAGMPDEHAREEVARRGAAWLESLRSGLRPLELIGTLAPLLGLLGTVIGMIDAFQQLENAGGRVDPATLSGGIWVALLTTAAGLSVAMPAVAAHTFLERQLERLHHRMQDAATRVFSCPTRNVEQKERSGTDVSPQAPIEPRLAEAAGAD